MGPASRRGLIICCIVTTILILAVVVTAVILYFTILKPKQPKITTQAVTLEYIKLEPFPFHLNITLGITLSVDNSRNYGSFEYKNSTTHVSYRGNEVAEAPILEDTIPAKGILEVSTTVFGAGDKMISDPNFPSDFLNGELNFSTSTKLHGVARVWKIIKVKASTFSSCNISVFVTGRNATAICSNKLDY